MCLSVLCHFKTTICILVYLPNIQGCSKAKHFLCLCNAVILIKALARAGIDCAPAFTTILSNIQLHAKDFTFSDPHYCLSAWWRLASIARVGEHAKYYSHPQLMHEYMLCIKICPISCKIKQTGNFTKFPRLRRSTDSLENLTKSRTFCWCKRHINEGEFWMRVPHIIWCCGQLALLEPLFHCLAQMPPT